MRQNLHLALTAIAVPLVALVLYEGFAVCRAILRTPDILAGLAEKPLRLADIPDDRLVMLERIEDPGFRRHHGVDGSTPGSGQTTITQSLVKRLYFSHFQPGFSKIEQTLIAWAVLDPALSKDDQLRAFLNVSELGTAQGRTVIGFGDAARTWLGKPLAEVSDDQWLSLVAMLPAPNRLDPQRHAAANSERVGRIKRYLAGGCLPRDGDDIWYKDCAA